MQTLHSRQDFYKTPLLSGTAWDLHQPSCLDNKASLFLDYLVVLLPSSICPLCFPPKSEPSEQCQQPSCIAHLPQPCCWLALSPSRTLSNPLPRLLFVQLSPQPWLLTRLATTPVPQATMAEPTHATNVPVGAATARSKMHMAKSATSGL